ncbi:hypothetical protein BASA81_012482 [Batrachochytrium salamandrivorans]|nr:hypothetical protein BASA81_012482 [Batrachochytrium salamandrivorans]
MLPSTLPQAQIVDDESVLLRSPVVDAELIRASQLDQDEEDMEEDVSEPTLPKPPKPLVERHPIKFMCAAIVVYIAVSLLMIALGGGWPIQISSLENLAKSSNPAYVQYDAMENWKNALVSRRFATSNTRRMLQDQIYRSEVNVFYQLAPSEFGNGSIFDYIALIRDFEAGLIREEFCVPSEEDSVERTELNQTCSGLYPVRDTPVNHFFPSFVHDGTTWLLNGLGTSQRTQIEVLQTWIQGKIYRYFSLSALSGNFSSTRSSFVVQSSNLDKLRGYINGEMLAKLEAGNAKYRNQFTVSWFGDNLLTTELNNALLHDTLLVAASAGVVGIMFLVLMGFDLIVMAVGLLSLAMAFPLAYAFFNVAFGFKEMFPLSFLSLYILFGVGSDACFVYLDEMANTESFTGTWWRAAKATFVTLSTTAVCFLVNASSPIVVFREWGIFMGIACLFCWLTVNTIFPFVVLVRRKSLAEKTRFRVRAGFHSVLFAVMKRYKWLALILSVVAALVCLGLLFPVNGPSPFRIGDAKSYSSAFFDPNTHNLGRIYALKDEFGWAADAANPEDGGSGGGDGGTDQVQCPDATYHVVNNKCELIPVTAKLEVTFVFAYDGTGACICDFPESLVLTSVADNTGWPESDVEITEFCATEDTSCSSGTPALGLRFSSASQESIDNLRQQLGGIQPGTSIGGFPVTAVTFESSTGSPFFTAAPVANEFTSAPVVPPITTSSPTPISLATAYPTFRAPTPYPTAPTTFAPFAFTAPVFAPTTSPSSLAPTASPTASPTTRFPTSAAPTSAAPTIQPTSQTPSTAPTTPAPTLPQCNPSCGNNGLCDPSTLKCTCYLGFTGTNCSIPLNIELSDESTEKISIGFGLKMSDPSKLDPSFQLATSPELQRQLLNICAAFCIQNNETTLPSSRCSQPPFTDHTFTNLTTLDLEGLGHRRLLFCAIADFAYYVLHSGESFPVTSPQRFNTLAKNFYRDYADYVQDLALIGWRNDSLAFFPQPAPNKLFISTDQCTGRQHQVLGLEASV